MHLVYQLLRGNAVVDSLFAVQPVRGTRPRFVRAQFYRYRFAAPGASGRYWQRELLGEYLRPVSLDDEPFRDYLRSYGFKD